MVFIWFANVRLDVVCFEVKLELGYNNFLQLFVAIICVGPFKQVT